MSTSPAVALRALSIEGVTACWSIRFSLRMMTSGAFRSTSFLSRLLRLMIRRYRSSSIAGGEVARIQEHQRPQVRRDDRDAFQTHPLRPIVAAASASTTLSRLVRSLIFCAAGLDKLLAQLLGQADQVELHEQLATAPAPTSAWKLSPYCSRSLRNSSSVRS